MGCGYIAPAIEALLAYQNWPTTTLRRSGSEPEPGTGVAYDLAHREGTGNWYTPYTGIATTETMWIGVQGAH